jgi:hypothetical protein
MHVIPIVNFCGVTQQGQAHAGVQKDYTDLKIRAQLADMQRSYWQASINRSTGTKQQSQVTASTQPAKVAQMAEIHPRSPLPKRPEPASACSSFSVRHVADATLPGQPSMERNADVSTNSISGPSW